MKDRDCYESCMHPTKVTYVNSFSRGSDFENFAWVISHSQTTHFSSIYFHQIDKFELIFNLKRNLRSNTFLARLEKVEKGLQKKNIYLIWVNSLSTYHFFI